VMPTILEAGSDRRKAKKSRGRLQQYFAARILHRRIRGARASSQPQVRVIGADRSVIDADTR